MFCRHLSLLVDVFVHVATLWGDGPGSSKKVELLFYSNCICIFFTSGGSRLECNLQLPPALGVHLVLIRLLRPANRRERLTCVWPRGFSACHLFLRARVASSFFTVYKKHRCRAASSELTPHPPASSANQWDVSNGERRKSRGTCCLSRGHVQWNTFI